MAEIFDSRRCFLGEGPLWHPLRQQLFWFDIINANLHSRKGEETLQWHFDELVSAAGWIDKDHLIIASEKALYRMKIDTGASEKLVDLEPENENTRSNDGRADPMGGFWIGTMGKQAQQNAGAIYRFYRGELRKIYSDITIPNSICFSPDGRILYFADTPKQEICAQSLDELGWPVGEPKRLIDLKSKGLFPDGSCTDAQGNIWNAQWGSGSVAKYSPEGEFLERFYVGGAHSSCPAIGGELFNTLFVTTAQEGMEQPSAADGVLFSMEIADLNGAPEPQVQL